MTKQKETRDDEGKTIFAVRYNFRQLLDTETKIPIIANFQNIVSPKLKIEQKGEMILIKLIGEKE